MSAWTELVRDHHATVYRVALGVLRDSAAAEDVAQDVFLSFLRNPSAIARAGNVRALACRSALNRALDVRKAGLRRVARETAVSERSVEVNPVDVVFRREVRDKVAELPEIHRQAVDLHFFQGLTIAETAEVLDVPRGTASRRLSDAIATLRKWLSAAAFVGLLAKLESELSRVEAAPVPAGLEKRLLNLPRTHGAEPRRPMSRGAKGAIAVAVAFLFAVSTGQWIRANHSRWEAEEPRPVSEEVASIEGAAPSDSAPAPDPAPRVAACCPSATPVTEIAAIPEVEETIEGFLFRTPEGLFLAGEVVPNPGEAAGLFRPYDGRLWRLSGGALDSWPACETTSFTAFLQDRAPASSAPHTRLRLRVRSAAAPQVLFVDQVKQVQGTEAAITWGVSQPFAGGGSMTYIPAEPGSPELAGAVWTVVLESHTVEFGPGPNIELGEVREVLFETDQEGEESAELSRVLLNELQKKTQQETPPATAATVLEVLEVESLNDSWLEAWRDVYAAASRVLTQPEPDADPAVRAADAARLGEALQRARLARAGQSPAAWRIRMENRFAAGAVAALAAEGLSAYLPGMPTEAELSVAFLNANSPEDFRMIIVARWGEDALSLTIEAFVSRSTGSGETRVDVLGEPHTLRELTELSPVDFLATIEATRSLKGNTIKSW